MDTVLDLSKLKKQIHN